MRYRSSPRRWRSSPTTGNEPGPRAMPWDEISWVMLGGRRQAGTRSAGCGRVLARTPTDFGGQCQLSPSIPPSLPAGLDQSTCFGTSRVDAGAGGSTVPVRQYIIRSKTSRSALVGCRLHPANLTESLATALDQFDRSLAVRLAGWRHEQGLGSRPRANIIKIVNGFPKMRMTDIEKATKNLLDWTDTDEWALQLIEVHMDHLDMAAEVLDVDEHDVMEMLGDAAEMLNPFILEDFFTARFGEDGELNVIDDYLMRRGWRESDSARRYLEALRDSIPSLYEVVDIDPGRSLTVRDLLVPGEEMTVKEKLGSKAASPWDRLAARIVTVNEERAFTGAILAFRPDATDDLLSAVDTMVKAETKALRKKSRRAAATGRKRGRRSTAVPPELREQIIRGLPCAQVFTHFWILDHLSRALAPLPELRNTDDEAMLLCEVRFPIIGDEERISALLDGIEGFERAADGAAHWRWCASGSPTHRLARVREGDPVAASENATATTNLGIAGIMAGALTLSVNSRERAERGQKLLSSRLGDLVGPALISRLILYWMG